MDATSYSSHCASLRGAGAKQCELYEVASIQGQLRHLFGVNDLSEGRVLALHFDLRDLRFDRHLRLDRGRGEVEIERAGLAHFKDQVRFLDALKARGGTCDS